MLHDLGLFTAFLVIVTGLSVMALGDWRKFKLKFAGLVLSTVAGGWFVVTILLAEEVPSCRSDAEFCTLIALYAIARNSAFIIFHIACGRDAIQFKARDRRATPSIQNRRAA